MCRKINTGNGNARVQVDCPVSSHTQQTRSPTRGDRCYRMWRLAIGLQGTQSQHMLGVTLGCGRKQLNGSQQREGTLIWGGQRLTLGRQHITIPSTVYEQTGLEFSPTRDKQKSVLFQSACRFSLTRDTSSRKPRIVPGAPSRLSSVP